MLDILRELVGRPPAGLEFLEYVFLVALVGVGFGCLYKLILFIVSIIKP